MAFKVIRNESQKNVEIQGANKPNFFLGTLTALNGNSDTTLHIRHDARTTDNSDPQYEFFDVPHTQFNNASGSAFANRDTAVTSLNILFKCKLNYCNLRRSPAIFKSVGNVILIF